MVNTSPVKGAGKVLANDLPDDYEKAKEVQRT
jgi:hypothetical protein